MSADEQQQQQQQSPAEQQQEQAPVPSIQPSNDGLFIHYGFVQDGVFHPIASERIGDYNERVQAGQESSQ